MSAGRGTSEKPFEQSHLLVGFESPSYREDAYFTAQVFSGLFGGGHVVPVVPGGAGEARALLRDLLVRVGAQGYGVARGSRGDGSGD